MLKSKKWTWGATNPKAHERWATIRSEQSVHYPVSRSPRPNHFATEEKPARISSPASTPNPTKQSPYHHHQNHYYGYYRHHQYEHQRHGGHQRPPPPPPPHHHHHHHYHLYHLHITIINIIIFILLRRINIFALSASIEVWCTKWIVKVFDDQQQSVDFR